LEDDFSEEGHYPFSRNGKGIIIPNKVRDPDILALNGIFMVESPMGNPG